MSDETTLLPCPFCGGEAETFNPFNTDGTWCVLCSECAAATGFEQTEAEAIAAWNTRAYLNPDGLPAGLTISDDGDLLNWRGENYVRQGSDTLTAEQVREAIEEAEAELLESCEYVGDMGQRKGDVLKAFGKMKQAIADELNAKLGSGTCELHYGEDDDGYDGWYCDECGGWFQAVRRDGRLVEPKHCQECGKAVKR